MSWTQPTEHQTGDVITAATWNQDVKDNVQFLHDRIVDMWVPAHHGTNYNGSIGHFPGVRIQTSATLEVCRIKFVVPDDYDSTEEIVVVFIPDTSTTAEYDLYTDYGSLGESYNTHSESVVNQPLAVTANELSEMDISGVLSSMAAEDYVGVDLRSSNGANSCCWYVLGIRFRYRRV